MSVTSLELSRVIINDHEEIWKDINDNVIYYIDTERGYEFYKEYDDRGNAVYFINSDGYELWSKYNEDGNLIYYKDSNNYEQYF